MNPPSFPAALLATLLVACDPPSLDTGTPQDSEAPLDDSDQPEPTYAGDYPLAEAGIRLYATEEQQHAGRVLGTGDLDGDGDDDLVVTTVRSNGYQGGAWVFTDLPQGEASLDVGIRLEGSPDTMGAGRAVGVGDSDGDGLDDLLLGAPYPGSSSLFLLRAPFDEDLNISDAAVRLLGQDGDYPGHGAALVDVSGDGLADALLGAYGSDLGGGDSGAVYVVQAPFEDGTISLYTAATATMVGAEPGDGVGRVVRSGGDVNGDGLADLLIGAAWADRQGEDRGLVQLVLAPFTGTSDLADAELTLLGEAPGHWAGQDVALADIDGDGLADPIVGAQGAASELRGAVYAITGGASGERGLESSDLVIHGEQLGWAAGWAVTARDIDGDDQAALLVGALGAGDGDTPGAAYLFEEPQTGAWTTADADARLLGERDDSYTGLGLAMGDLDGDGLGDLIIGAPLHGGGGEAAGAVYVQGSALPGLPD
jgi:hypothetical protein